MNSQNNSIETLKLKLKSVTKLKLSRDRDLLKMRNKERSISEELSSLKAEIDFFNDQLQDFKGQISQMRHQISMIEICKVSEKIKAETHSRYIHAHRKGFLDLFQKERDQLELRNKEIEEKEAKEQELLRQKYKVVAEKNDQQIKEAVAVENESDAVEKECAVLKVTNNKICDNIESLKTYLLQKRNNAIMLKLRRKLIETENNRRAMLKRNVNLT